MGFCVDKLTQEKNGINCSEETLHLLHRKSAGNAPMG